MECLMKRRLLLQSVATLPILSGGFAFLSASAKAARERDADNPARETL